MSESVFEKMSQEEKKRAVESLRRAIEGASAFPVTDPKHYMIEKHEKGIFVKNNERYYSDVIPFKVVSDMFWLMHEDKIKEQNARIKV